MKNNLTNVIAGSLLPFGGKEREGRPPLQVDYTNVGYLYRISIDRMSLWVDKYRPTSLSKLDYHKDLAAHLKKLVCLVCLCTK